MARKNSLASNRLKTGIAPTNVTKQIIYPGNTLTPAVRGRKSFKQELGTPGLEIYHGIVTEEFRPELQGYRGVQIYEEMRRNDAVVASMLLIAEHLIHNASLMVMPSEQNPDAQKSLKAADLVYTSIEDMGNSWTDTLSEILTFLAFGWSVCSVWHKQRNGYSRDKWKSSRHTDGQWGWAGISLRAQTTLDRWETDEKDHAIGMWQMGAPTWDRAYIPFTHAGHFRTRTDRDNPEGVSVLRSSYRAWSIKKIIETTEAMGIERDVAGVPIIIVPEGLNLWNSKDPDAAATLTRANEIVQNIRLDKYAGVVLPYGWELKIINTPGQRAHNSDKVISRWDQRIAVTMLADMLLIGQQNVGSFALVQGKIKLFSSALEAYAARVAGVFNRDLIPRLMLLNGIRQEYWPTLRFGPVETPSLVDMAAFIKSLWEVGVPIDEATSLYLKQIANFPPKSGLPSKRAEALHEQLNEPEPEESKTEPEAEEGPEPPDTDEPEGEEGSSAGVSKGFVIPNTPIARYSVGLKV